MYEKRFRLWETAALLALALTLLSGVWARGRQRSIAGELLRLHVIAASDEAGEQALKLEVRDAVLAYLRPRMAGAESAAQAEELLRGELEGVREAAESASRGRPVSVLLGEEDYPLRRYGRITLPAGRYRSLRVVLGTGQGRNWWCVVFPPLCLEAAEETLRESMSREDYAIVSGEEGFVLRSRLVELWGELANALR